MFRQVLCTRLFVQTCGIRYIEKEYLYNLGGSGDRVVIYHLEVVGLILSTTTFCRGTCLTKLFGVSTLTK